MVPLRALKRAIEKGSPAKQLDGLADKTVDMALAGDSVPIEKITDRLHDGQAKT